MNSKSVTTAMNLPVEIEKIQFAPNLVLFYSRNWVPNREGYREQIYYWMERLRLQTKLFQASISHSAEFGGFILCDQDIGLDIERTERVTESVINRVADPLEASQILFYSLKHSSLWCAKESAWKAFRNQKQPKVISSVKIKFGKINPFDLTFSPIDPTYFFEATTPETPMNQGVEGFGFEHETSTFAICGRLYNLRTK